MRVTIHGNSRMLMQDAERVLRERPHQWAALGARYRYRLAVSIGHHVSEDARTDYRYHWALRVGEI